MAVYRLCKNEAFEPEAISTMTHAYAEVCRTLGLTERDRGARHPGRLRDCVLQAMRGSQASRPNHGCAARQSGL